MLIAESSHESFMPWRVMNTPEFVGGSDDTESACKRGVLGSIPESEDLSMGYEGFIFLSYLINLC